jgi:hypothetical protein
VRKIISSSDEMFAIVEKWRVEEINQSPFLFADKY